MSLIFVDSFDHYTDNNECRKWQHNSGQIYQTGGRRNGGYVKTDATYSRLLKGLGPYDSFVVGFAFYNFGSLGTVGMKARLASFGYDEYYAYNVDITDSGAITVWVQNQGNGTTELIL